MFIFLFDINLLAIIFNTQSYRELRKNNFIIGEKPDIKPA